MSHAYYNAMWQQAMEELSEILDVENPPPAVDVMVRYIMIMQRVECMLHAPSLLVAAASLPLPAPIPLSLEPHRASPSRTSL